jgi:acetate kinase
LGNGSSVAAVRDGRSIDTTMGFTPMSGLPMSTRSGDLDPGLVAYLAELEGLSIADFHHLVSAESGLLGISETSSDMRDLLARAAAGDARAEDAVALYCYAVRKCIGAYAAALGGLDILVFTGGIGEHAPEVRARICSDFAWIGIELDGERNANSASRISSAQSRVDVRVLAADEEAEIAAAVFEHLNGDARERP